MYKFFVGVDISKDVIDVGYNKDSKSAYLDQFENSVAGFKKMIKLLKPKTKEPKKHLFICFENTGVYSKLLLNWLLEKDYPCREENALLISKSIGIRRGKDDRID